MFPRLAKPSNIEREATNVFPAVLDRLVGVLHIAAALPCKNKGRQ